MWLLMLKRYGVHIWRSSDCSATEFIFIFAARCFLLASFYLDERGL